jgi:hypothetical protein
MLTDLLEVSHAQRQNESEFREQNPSVESASVVFYLFRNLSIDPRLRQHQHVHVGRHFGRSKDALRRFLII